ncbi:MAG: hypothetical protein PVS3B3_23840 [Ktedonobacteraceae bacterium]
MSISSVIGLIAALIGSTATLLTAWAYIRSQHPPKGEVFRATLAIIVIMIGILGFAVFVSRATITINGQNTISAPSFPAPGFIPPTRGTTPTPTSTSLSTPTPTPTLTPSPTLSPSPSSSPTGGPLPSSTPTISPSPTSNSTK